MSEKNSFEKIINSHQLVLIDFHATWCGPCKAMEPVLHQLENDLADKVKVVKIDVDEETALAVAQKVMGVPTLMLYQKGELQWSEPGTKTLQELKDIINHYL